MKVRISKWTACFSTGSINIAQVELWQNRSLETLVRVKAGSIPSPQAVESALVSAAQLALLNPSSTQKQNNVCVCSQCKLPNSLVSGDRLNWWLNITSSFWVMSQELCSLDLLPSLPCLWEVAFPVNATAGAIIKLFWSYPPVPSCPCLCLYIEGFRRGGCSTN